MKYIWLINLFSISKNNFKNWKNILVIVLKIKINYSNFLVNFLKKKFEKVVKAISKIFCKKSINISNI